MLEFLTTTTSDVVHNEWAKLAAMFWNNSAVAAFVGGVVTPMFSDKVQGLDEGRNFHFGNAVSSCVSLHRTSFHKHDALSYGVTVTLAVCGRAILVVPEGMKNRDMDEVRCRGIVQPVVAPRNRQAFPFA